MNLPFPIREECPPGACVCDRERLLSDPRADVRILKLTKFEEKRLIARIESVRDYADLKHVESRLHEQLGIRLHIVPSANEVRTVRGFNIHLEACPGLCRLTRKSIPAAVRRCLEARPDIAYDILNAHDLLRDA
ncbi:hypothetical protein CAL14_03225 [Bordetella genomosp. 9]|uniref:hypothetical protein n=1 Tax=Bordetella genomosp. 9 TaxID=1416803 RepID=UPI000A28FF60|nr:hypothetical protein [Bordetella genomosp. 9]ARP92475.1 hypothetical protein CAL14_03225 [Bordetella genomosp. 9]